MPGPLLRPGLPGHVAICHQAIAGGLVGMPVHAVFRDYPTWLAAGLFGRFRAWVGSDRATHVHAERDLRALEQVLAVPERSAATRLVLVTAPKLAERVGWILASHWREGGGPVARPVMLAVQRAGSTADLPGPALSLLGSSSQARLSAEWLRAGEAAGPLPVPADAPAVDFSAVTKIFAAGEAHPCDQMPRLIDELVLRGLMAGAAVLRSAESGGPGAPLVILPDDYRAVYDRIRLVATQAADAPLEPLTKFMVERANAYLRMRAATAENCGPKPGAGPTPGGRHITRRELTDLGNVRGPTVHELVKWLFSRGDAGLAEFKTLGTNRPLKDSAPWPAADPAALAAILLSWSPKQVRTHFARLQTEGFITGTRAADNQPWVYRLPEAVGTSDSPFQCLPPPDALEPPPPARAGPATRAGRTAPPPDVYVEDRPAGPVAPGQGDANAETI